MAERDNKRNENKCQPPTLGRWANKPNPSDSPKAASDGSGKVR